LRSVPRRWVRSELESAGWKTTAARQTAKVAAATHAPMRAARGRVAGIRSLQGEGWFKSATHMMKKP
jgi:hypothetical protein